MVIMVTRVLKETSEYERLRILEKYFLGVLVQDGQDGTVFDNDVLDAIRGLKEKYKKEVKQ
ncbi:MAG: hypothetical protein UX31_C0005G0031 [Candidatus Nomurabacteria bacterium GW2011_GWA1_46_11]|uniref:Uncharacterized protein n=2 Tax=Parcubacteria group TaxID=1794811 RepID=A0A1G1YVT0_9BACT|nr:MAG: hypothetical protein UX29_C0002G0024 [Parcubacteria group bacterium GW2011_GWA2_46_10]KKU22221.1 MAG: hypothetical protein UX31_C0005G0031 [Candidatus Nomurabacteria bacterium GW2011_GWA1_46_11]OGY56485.1 MAG: hypothetical protein A2119_00115 [Candidatus Colwellbacteria bacterium GWA2_46_10]